MKKSALSPRAIRVRGLQERHPAELPDGALVVLGLVSLAEIMPIFSCLRVWRLSKAGRFGQCHGQVPQFVSCLRAKTAISFDAPASSDRVRPDRWLGLAGRRWYRGPWFSFVRGS